MKSYTVDIQKQLGKTEIIPTLFAITGYIDFIFEVLLEKLLSFHSHVRIVFHFNFV